MNIREHLIQFADPRNRNQLGQFAPGVAGGGVDPDAAQVVYSRERAIGDAASGAVSGIAGAAAVGAGTGALMMLRRNIAKVKLASLLK